MNRSRCDEHRRFVTVRHVACARPTGGTHGLTTQALKLLMSIGFPLENTKGRSPVEPLPWRIIYALAGGSCISYRGGTISLAQRVLSINVLDVY
jgi:hypothetical protein